MTFLNLHSDHSSCNWDLKIVYFLKQILLILIPGVVKQCNGHYLRPHIKMLSGDYLCCASLAHDRGIDPQCRMCQVLSTHPSPTEDLVHLLTMCRATADTRNRILPELLNTVASSDPSNSLLTSTNHDTLTQFILDCSSLNLPANTRVPPNHPGFVNITKQCSNFINGIHKERTRQMKALGLLGRI